MATSTDDRRELAVRAGDGIEVSLFWSKLRDRVTVAISDLRLDHAFEFEVDAVHALDAFNHPYAYASKRS